MSSPRTTDYIKTIRCHDVLVWLIKLSMIHDIYTVCEENAALERFNLETSDDEVYRNESKKISINALAAKKEYIGHVIDKKKIKIPTNRLMELYAAIYIQYSHKIKYV